MAFFIFLFDDKNVIQSAIKKIATKESGLVCEGENTRLKGKDCITYEMKEARTNS